MKARQYQIAPKESQDVSHCPAVISSTYLTFHHHKILFCALGPTFIESNENDKGSCQQGFLTTAGSIHARSRLAQTLRHATPTLSVIRSPKWKFYEMLVHKKCPQCMHCGHRRCDRNTNLVSCCLMNQILRPQRRTRTTNWVVRIWSSRILLQFIPGSTKIIKTRKINHVTDARIKRSPRPTEAST